MYKGTIFRSVLVELFLAFKLTYEEIVNLRKG